jgi:hypothetical protein
VDVNSNPCGYLKWTLPGGIQLISTYIFEERGCREWTHTVCVDFFLLNKMVFIYSFLMLHALHIINKLFVLWKFKELNFKFHSPEPPLLALLRPSNWKSKLNTSTHNPKIGTFWHFDNQTIKSKSCFYKINPLPHCGRPYWPNTSLNAKCSKSAEGKV